MAEKPTYSDIVSECAKIEQYIPDESTMSVYIDRALAEVKLHLYTKQNIKWPSVYDSENGVYFTDTDGNTNNADQLLRAIRLFTIALIYRDSAQASNDSMYWDLYIAYRQDAETALDTARLDIDLDESGVIDDGEENTSSQRFFHA